MYWNVPTIAPSAVSGAAIVGMVLWLPVADVGASCGRASPKSMSLAPDRVSMMLPGA